MPLPIVFNLPSIRQKEILFIGFSATLYDYLLVFDDEITYVWKGRKTSIFYLYILNRALLIAYQFWNFYYNIIITPDESVLLSPGPFRLPSVSELLAEICIQTLLSAFFLLSSDTFVTLRMYAISKSKIVTAYFVTLASARFLTLLVGTFLPQSERYNVSALDSKLNLISVSIGTAFEVSAFIVVIWYTHRNRRALEISSLVRAIAKQATIYFLVIVGVQIYLQVALRFGTREDLFGSSTTSIYCFFNPVLTLRFAIALKKSADPGGGEKWQLKHFSTLEFASGPPADDRGSIGMGSVDTASHGGVQMIEPQFPVEGEGLRGGLRDV